MALRIYDPYTDFGCVQCDLDIGDITLTQGN